MYGFIIPAKGRELIASLLAGDTLTITRCMVGEGAPQEGVEPSALTDLVKPIAQATSTAPIVNRQQVDLTVEYRNDLNGGLENGFYRRRRNTPCFSYGDISRILRIAIIGKSVYNKVK